MMMDFLSLHWLDILTTILGLIYIWLEYRAHIALWVVGIVMPALDIILYWQHGLYGEAGMACYYTLAAVYGLFVWKFKKTHKKHEPLSIIYMPRKQYLPTVAFFMVAWVVIYYILIRWTDSTVPVLDSFDVVCTILYVQKGIPFKALLYGLYVVIAIAGYYKWKGQAKPLTVIKDE